MSIHLKPPFKVFQVDFKNFKTILEDYLILFQHFLSTFLLGAYILIKEIEFILDEIIYEEYSIGESDRAAISNQFRESCIAYPIIDGYYYNIDFKKNIINEYDLQQFGFEINNSNMLFNECQKSLHLVKIYYEGNLDITHSKEIKPKKIILNETQINDLISNIEKLSCKKGTNIIKIAEELKIHPRSILAIMEQNDLYIEEDLIETVKRYLQTLARKAFDNDSDGIVLLPEVLNKIHDELDKTFGDNASSIETEIINIIGKSIEKWLRDDLAIDYINNKGYDKKKDKYDEIKNPWEPLMWKGQSPKKNFTVFVWRYKITPDTELKIRSQYLDGEIDSYKNKVKELNERASMLEEKEKNNLEKERDEILYILDDLNDYKEWIKENGVKLRGMWFNWE